MKDKLLVAKVAKLLTAIASCVLLIYKLIKEIPWFFKLTRPCAFSSSLELLTLAGIALLFVISLLPISLKTKVIRNPDGFLRNVSLLMLFGIFGNAVSTWLQCDYLIKLYVLDWYYITDFVLCMFFIVLFINHYFREYLRILPIFLGVTYICITVLHQLYSAGHVHHGIFKNGMIIIVFLIIVHINVFKNLYHMFYFSDYSNNDFMLDDKSIKMKNVYSTAYSVQNKKCCILLRNDKRCYYCLDISDKTKRLTPKKAGLLREDEDGDFLDEMLTDLIDKDKQWYGRYL